MPVPVPEQCNESPDANPEKDRKQFDVDGRTFHIKPMNFRWGREFRKYAVPIICAEFRPFETLVVGLMSDRLAYESDWGFTKAVIDNEIEVDALLPEAAGAICASQDEEASKTKDRAVLVEVWAAKCEELPREELYTVVKEQCAAEQIMAQLEGSLGAAFKTLLGRVGEKFDIVSLLRPPARTAPKSEGERCHSHRLNSRSSFTA